MKTRGSMLLSQGLSFDLYPELTHYIDNGFFKIYLNIFLRFPIFFHIVSISNTASIITNGDINKLYTLHNLKVQCRVNKGSPIISILI